MQRPSRPGGTTRWQRIALFDDTVLPEIHRDDAATATAMITVAAVMFISSLGGFFWYLAEDGHDKLAFFLESVIVGTALATGMFFVWIGIVAGIAGQIGGSDHAALRATVRTLSFASVPFAFSSLIFIPGLAYPITLIAIALLVISTTLATQIATGRPTGRALGVNLVGFFLWTAVMSTLMSPSNAFAPAVFLWERFAV